MHFPLSRDLTPAFSACSERSDVIGKEEEETDGQTGVLLEVNLCSPFQSLKVLAWLFSKQRGQGTTSTIPHLEERGLVNYDPSSILPLLLVPVTV